MIEVEKSTIIKQGIDSSSLSPEGHAGVYSDDTSGNGVPPTFQEQLDTGSVLALMLEEKKYHHGFTIKVGADRRQVIIEVMVKVWLWNQELYPSGSECIIEDEVLGS